MSKAEIEELLNQLPPEKAKASKMKAGEMDWSVEQQLNYLVKRLGWQDLEEMATREVDKPDEPVDAEEIAAELREVKLHSKGRMSRSPRARQRGPLHKG